MKFITAIYFTDDKARKVIFVDNPHDNCIDASNYSKRMENALLSPKSVKDIRSRTYELGAISHSLN